MFAFLFFSPFQIYAVRSVVPNKSNNEIVLVLQQFDFNVDKAVQAFVDGEYMSCEPVDVRTKYSIYSVFSSLNALNTDYLLILYFS